jgi:hypothetical protein
MATDKLDTGALFVAHCRCSHLERRNACGKQRLGDGDFSLARNATPDFVRRRAALCR